MYPQRHSKPVSPTFFLQLQQRPLFRCVFPSSATRGSDIAERAGDGGIALPTLPLAAPTKGEGEHSLPPLTAADAELTGGRGGNPDGKGAGEAEAADPEPTTLLLGGGDACWGIAAASRARGSMGETDGPEDNDEPAPAPATAAHVK